MDNSRILTVDNLFEKYKILCSFEEGEPAFLIEEEDFKSALLAHTKYHVKKALEKAANEAKLIKYYNKSTEHYIDNGMATEDGIIEIHKSSILNAYPEDLIK